MNFWQVGLLNLFYIFVFGLLFVWLDIWAVPILLVTALLIAVFN